MSRNDSSPSSFHSASAILASAFRQDVHPFRGAGAVVAAHRPLREPVKKIQKPWTRWNNYKLSLVHTHKTCGMRRDLHQTDCLRCVERCGLLPLISRLNKKRNLLKRLLEHSDVLHMIAFCFRFTRGSMNMAPNMVQQEFQQKVAFGWVAPILYDDQLEDDSDEEWTKAAMMVQWPTKG